MCRAGWKRSDPGARPDPRSGLTLIELMVVVVVMAVLAGAIVPNLVSAAGRVGMDRATADVGDLLDFAAAVAIARRQPVAVSFDPEHGTCQACLCTTELPWLAEEASAGASVLASLRLPDGVKIAVAYGPHHDTGKQRQSPSGTVRFWPDGRADEAEVQLTDAHGLSEVLPVRPAAGEVVLIEEE